MKLSNDQVYTVLAVNLYDLDLTNNVDNIISDIHNPFPDVSYLITRGHIKLSQGVSRLCATHSAVFL